MNLHEYQGKEILASFGVRIQRGIVANTPEEVRKMFSILEVGVDGVIFTTSSINEVSEIILGFTGSDASNHQVDINNATLTLASAANQTELEQLTSFTSSVTVTVAADGQSLSVTRDSDDAELLTVEIIIDTIAVKLLGDFDQFDEKTLETYIKVNSIN